MLLDLVVFALGLAGLYFGAEWLIGGAVRIAASLGVSSFIVGLTLVSFGTSAPELLVSGLASFQGNGGLAIGNVLGSNVANIGLILGVAALIVVIRTHEDVIGRDMPIMIGFAALVPALGWSGDISRLEGGFLLALFLAYTFFLARNARRGSVERALEGEVEVEESTSMGRDAAIAVFGLVVLAVGAQLLVTSAVSIATALQVPDVVIGLTLVALGTSLPELAASISAARRQEGDIVVGNIIGSNIFNVALILGVAAVIRPLPVSEQVLRVDAPIVIALSLLLFPIVYTGMRVSRREGGLLVASYVAFILWTAL